MGPAEDLEAQQLVEMLRAVRDRVRARHPQGSAASLALPDLLPLLHARDAAEAKVAAIGSVNPRPSGPLNAVIQAVKRVVARLLDWHVREQVEFNRQTMACVQAALEALTDANRALAELAHAQAALKGDLNGEVQQLKDVRSHWAEWRPAWERKLADNEMRLLRGLAELQAASQQRAAQIEANCRDREANFRELASTQHAAFTAALERNGLEIQRRFWSDLETARLELERVVHEELRILRQRAALQSAAPPPPAPPAAAADFDYDRFAERFRGSEESVRERQRFYVPFFAGRRAVLDAGCGRGEFLELMREAGVPARGIDASADAVARCRQKNLDAEQADVFESVAGLADGGLDGLFCAQFVEHIPPERLPELLRLFAAKLGRGGLLAIETPNPECLAIFATHFYLDPTHRRPVPRQLLAFYMEEFGFGHIEAHGLAPALDSMSEVAALPEEFRRRFFGDLDYVILGRKLS